MINKGMSNNMAVTMDGFLHFYVVPKLYPTGMVYTGSEKYLFGLNYTECNTEIF